MELVLAAIIVIGIIAFIAYPLFTAPPEEIGEASDALDGLSAQRDSAYDAIRDLDFDFQLGKLSQSDYAALRERYKTRAALALQQIDALDGNGNGAKVEDPAAPLRAVQPAAPSADDAVEREIARLRASKSAAAGLRCAKCGAPYRAGDAFCAKCGSPLKAKNG